jgi:predicted nucleic acid-binding protein
MARMAGRRVFIDTNVLVYATREAAPLHEIAYGRLLLLENENADLWISRQVLRELCHVLLLSDPGGSAMTSLAVVQAATDYAAKYWVADEDQLVSEILLDLISSHALSARLVHDANIVATMKAYGIDILLTHNVSDFKRFEDLIEILPLKQAVNLSIDILE